MAIKNDETTQSTIEMYVNNLNEDAVGNDALVVPPLTDLNNTNRTILQIVNTNQTEPIKAQTKYNTTTQKIEIEVTYTKNGISKIIDEEGNILSENSNTAQTGTEIEIGEHTYIIIDNEENIEVVKATKPNPIIITASDYGKEVTNYTCSAIGVDKWRIFHKDDTNIYLIADDYVSYMNLPTSTKETSLKKTSASNNYKANFSTIINDYTGSAWIKNNTNTNAQKWLDTYLNAYPNSTNTNIKAVAYMMDTKSWNGFAGKDAEYAIGGPTLELFCASYEETHPSKYIECDSVISNGYRIKWNTATSYSTNNISGLKKDEYNSIYIKSDTTKASGMWIAAPSSKGNLNLSHAYNDAVIYLSDGYASVSLGFRPVVCLKPEVQLIDNGDGTFRLR